LSRKEEGSVLSTYPGKIPLSERAFQGSTISVIPLSLDHCKPGFDWAAACAEPILRWCPLCLSDSVIGHGWRRKQAHDDSHDWIKYRRGLCNLCELTFSFLPAFSLPYTHFSLVARSEALRRRFVEHCSWESSAPTVKDPNRIPDPSTLRRWCRSLDSSPAFSFLRRTVEAVEQWLARGEQLAHDSLRLSWPTVFCFLRVVWPWPLRL
jgi:Domain of unknown function (DUF6431)